MKTYQVVQGSPEWLALRSGKFCASDAAAMMGEDPKTSRSKLLHLLANGDSKEFSAWVQENLLDKGHELEAKARSLAEGRLGEDLYPATIGDDNDTADGEMSLLASCDGITMDGETGWEHKSWNEELAAMIRAGSLPPKIYWQLEQQMLIGSMKRVFLTCSDGTDEKMVEMEYTPVRGRAKKLIAGWKQFAEDLKTYRAPEVKEPVVADVIMALPTVTIQTEGKIALRSNLAEFGELMQTFISGIKMKPETDQEFANADAAVKELDRAEKALKAAEAAALAQDTTIDELRRTVASYLELMSKTRIALGKAVEAQKAKIRDDIRVRGENEYNDHIAMLNQRLGRPYLAGQNKPASDFPGVMKNKKSLDSLNDAVNSEIARLKIISNEVADKIAINQNVMNELAVNHKFLFADVGTIIFKEVDDLTALVKMRIAEHDAKVKAEAEAKAKAEADANARQVSAPAPAAATPAAAPATQPAPVSGVAGGGYKPPTPAQIVDALAANYGVHQETVMDWLLKMPFAMSYEPGEIIKMGGPDYVMTQHGTVKQQARLPGVG